jgi:hypothetical protein
LPSPTGALFSSKFNALLKSEELSSFRSFSGFPE